MLTWACAWATVRTQSSNGFWLLIGVIGDCVIVEQLVKAYLKS